MRNQNERRDGQWKISTRTNAIDWSGMVPTMPIPFADVADGHLNGVVAQFRGRIVTVVSVLGRVGEARLSAYSAAKAAAAGFMRSIAKETGRYGITANAVSLSTLEPAMNEAQKQAFMASERTKAQLSKYTIRRFGKPDDVANMVLFLCSDSASWITGQTYPVNGGFSFAQ